MQVMLFYSCQPNNNIYEITTRNTNCYYWCVCCVKKVQQCSCWYITSGSIAGYQTIYETTTRTAAAWEFTVSILPVKFSMFSHKGCLVNRYLCMHMQDLFLLSLNWSCYCCGRFWCAITASCKLDLYACAWCAIINIGISSPMIHSLVHAHVSSIPVNQKLI